jgi:hypothetical protein
MTVRLELDERQARELARLLRWVDDFHRHRGRTVPAVVEPIRASVDAALADVRMSEHALPFDAPTGAAWLSTAHAAELLGVTPRAIQLKVARGRLEARRVGRSLAVLIHGDHMEPTTDYTRFSLRIDRPIGLVNPDDDPPMWIAMTDEAIAQATHAMRLANTITPTVADTAGAMRSLVVDATAFAGVVARDVAAFTDDVLAGRLVDFDRVQRLGDMQTIYRAERDRLETKGRAAYGALVAAVDVAAAPTPLPPGDELLVRQELDLVLSAGGASALAHAAARDTRAATVLAGAYGHALAADDDFGIGALVLPATRARLAADGEPRVRVALTTGPELLNQANEAVQGALWAVHNAGSGTLH